MTRITCIISICLWKLQILDFFVGSRSVTKTDAALKVLARSFLWPHFAFHSVSRSDHLRGINGERNILLIDDYVCFQDSLSLLQGSLSGTKLFLKEKRYKKQTILLSQKPTGQGTDKEAQKWKAISKRLMLCLMVKLFHCQPQSWCTPNEGKKP
jgi:hypothetical protein